MTKRFCALFLCVFAIAVAFGQSPTAPGEHFPGVVWVKVKPEYRDSVNLGRPGGRLKNRLDIRSINSLIPSASIKPESRNGRSSRKQGIDISLYLEIAFDPGESVAAVIDRLKATPYFDAVEPVLQTNKPLSIPSDPFLGQQYHLELIKAYDAWDVTKGDENMVVAIIDTGGDLDHPDLRHNLFIDTRETLDGIDNDGDGYIDNYRGWDFSGPNDGSVTADFPGDNDPSIFSGGGLAHGTKVGGCAAATTDNGVGIAGIGYHTKLMFLKHSSDNSSLGTFSSSTYKGVLYAATHGARILNCSWGRKGRPSVIEQDIIRYVTVDLGCLVIAAAGNDNTAEPYYPASYDYAMSVAASNSTDAKHTNSSYGRTVDITAPGAAILSTSFNDSYAVDNGTSLAAPIVSGAAALVWAKNPTFTPLQVAEQLRASADETFYNMNGQYDLQLGKGRLNVLNALTQEIPSIRASSPRLLDKNGKPLTPGDTGTLSLDFVNFLKASSPSLIVTAFSSSPYITIGKVAVGLGAINTLDTLHQSNIFAVTLSRNAPPLYEVDIVLRYFDGSYFDFQNITLRSPSYQNITENNIKTSLAANGRIGFGTPESQTEGYGFISGDRQLVSEIGIIMGNSDAYLLSNTRSNPGQYDEDLVVKEAPLKFTPGERSSSEIRGSFRDQSQTVSVDYKSLVWKKENGSPYNDFVIIEYTIKNTTSLDLPGFYFGIFADWDVSSQGLTDIALWESSRKMGCVLQAAGAGFPCAGIQLLKGTPNYYAIETSSIHNGYSKSQKYTHISEGLVTTVAGSPWGDDVSHVVSSGPHTIGAGDTLVIAFAFHAASDLQGLQRAADYADTLYNLTLQTVPPVIDEIKSCYARDAVLSPQGATKYSWYRDFTGGTPLASGATFTLHGLTKDTTVYVANADHSYESVRAEARVVINPSPTADFIYQANVLDPDEVSFTDKSTNADEWSWNFGDGYVSTEKDPVHLFDQVGNFTVTLTVQNEYGCEDSKSEVFLVTGIAETLTGQINAFPNPLKINAVTLDYPEALASEISHIEIIDSNGRKVSDISPTGDRHTVDLSSCKSGLYLIRLHFHRGASKTIKLIKEK